VITSVKWISLGVLYIHLHLLAKELLFKWFGATGQADGKTSKC